MRQRRAAAPALLLLLVTGLAGCGPVVSDHDNRIFSAAASVKLSAVDLSTAYHSDAGAADGRYRGRVIEISGVVNQVHAIAGTAMLTGGDGAPTVEVSLHEDVAATLVKTMADGQRITLKCFCEGLDQHVRLRSCVAPDPSR